ncbi:MAG: DUF296 domain-containing protein [Cyclobacteriaceae bacterium]
MKGGSLTGHFYTGSLKTITWKVFIKARQGHFEILSLSGTLSASSAHLHLCVADESGTSTGGHLLDKNVIYTTAEIAIVNIRNMEFERVFDPDSGYRELSVKHNAEENKDGPLI